MADGPWLRTPAGPGSPVATVVWLPACLSCCSATNWPLLSRTLSGPLGRGGWFLSLTCCGQPTYAPYFSFTPSSHQSIPYYCLCGRVLWASPGENNCVHFLGPAIKSTTAGRLKQERFILLVLGARSLGLRCWQGQAPPNAPGEDSSWPLQGLWVVATRP